jgi:glutamine synthetase
MTVYVETFAEAIPSKERIAEVRKELEDAGVEYVLSSWIDLFGIPKTKPVPMSDFTLFHLCLSYRLPIQIR